MFGDLSFVGDGDTIPLGECREDLALGIVESHLAML